MKKKIISISMSLLSAAIFAMLYISYLAGGCVDIAVSTPALFYLTNETEIVYQTPLDVGDTIHICWRKDYDN